MAKKRRRVRYDRIVLCVLVSILLIAIIVMGIRYILKDDTSKNDTVDNNTTVVTNSDIKIELEKYTVYEDKNNDLGFNFVIVTLKFTSDNSVSYDLTNLKTSEGVVLSEISDYQKTFASSNYNYNSLGTTLGIASSDKEVSVKVFVPYKSGSVITLTDSVSNASIAIDTTTNKGDIDTFKKADNTQDIVSNDYNITVSNSYIASRMLHNGEAYDSSMLNVYVFEMKVNSISNNVKVTKATFKQSSTGETWDAMDESYSTSKSGSEIKNILNTSLTTGDSYALFFDVYSNGDETPDYKGTITFTFSDGTSTTIDTELN